MTGKGEGEAQWQTSTFHSHVVQEVRDAVDDVVEELERQTERLNGVCSGQCSY